MHGAQVGGPLSAAGTSEDPSMQLGYPLRFSGGGIWLPCSYAAQ